MRHLDLVLATTASLTAAACVTAVLAVPAVAGPPQDRPRTAPQEVSADGVIVRWAAGVEMPEQARARDAAGVRLRDRLPLAQAEVIDVPAGETRASVVARLRRDPRVLYAEPDAIVRPSSDDPGFGLLWGLDNTGQVVNDRPGAADVDLDEPEANAAVAASGAPAEPVLVAVTDSGVDVRHDDLAGAIWINPDEVPANGVDDDRNGYVDDVNGWDFVDNDASVYDDPVIDGHGTHVAGTIGATRDNRVGIAGVTSQVRLMPLKFIGPDGGSTSDAIRAIAYAADKGAGVINASWGGPEDSQALRDAIAASGAVVVAAAGNDGVNNDVDPDFPASYGLSNLLSVAAVGNTGELAGFSNVGATSVDLGAPGVDVLSTFPDNSYAYLNGTSMAAPHVSGVAALVRSVRPDLDPEQVVALILDSVRPLESLALRTRTGGMVNAGEALSVALSGSEPQSAPDAPTEPAGEESTGNAAPQEPCPDGIPSAGFGDLAGNVHVGAVDCGVWYGILRGTSSTMYSPEVTLQRGQAASVLAAILQLAGRLPASAPDVFVDDDDSVHEANIEKLVSLGIARGRDATHFEPGGPVTRGQLATLLVATKEYLDGSPLLAQPTTFTDIYTDVHRISIEKAATAGLVRGTSPVTYSPEKPTARDQAASLTVAVLEAAVRAGDVPHKRG